MNKRLILPLVCLTLTLVAAVTVPLFRYFEYRDIARHGEKLMFRVAGFDPYDPLRGRFVRIRLEPDSMNIPSSLSLKQRWKFDGFAEFRTGPDGLAQAVGFSEEEPSGGTFWCMRDCWISGTNNNNEKLFLSYPVDRFYMNELLAPEAEKVMRDAKKLPEIRAEVRLKSGAGLIREVYVDGIPLAEYVRKHRSQAD